ncbi:MAG: hypothetical protein HC863_02705 [Myxococcales bacterium]|nr:hypothetical protein [Myxococcales bacterium]
MTSLLATPRCCWDTTPGCGSWTRRWRRWRRRDLWWAIGLCRQASHQLLDVTTKPELEAWVRRRLEAIDDVRVADLHVWEIGPGQHGCVVSLVSARPRDVEHYRSALLSSSELAHLTVEIHGCNRAHRA